MVLKTERFVDDFVAALGQVGRKQQQAWVEEVEGRIGAGFAAGRTEEEILADLGTPEALAAALKAEAEGEPLPLPPVTAGRTVLSILLFFLCLGVLWPLLLSFVLILFSFLLAAMVFVAAGVFILIMNFVAPIWPDLIQGFDYGFAANTLLSVAWICFGLLLCIGFNRILRAGASLAGHIWRYSWGMIFYRKRRRKYR